MAQSVPSGSHVPPSPYHDNMTNMTMGLPSDRSLFSSLRVRGLYDSSMSFFKRKRPSPIFCLIAGCAPVCLIVRFWSTRRILLSGREQASVDSFSTLDKLASILQSDREHTGTNQLHYEMNLHFQRRERKCSERRISEEDLSIISSADPSFSPLRKRPVPPSAFRSVSCTRTGVIVVSPRHGKPMVEP